MFQHNIIELIYWWCLRKWDEYLSHLIFNINYQGIVYVACLHYTLSMINKIFRFEHIPYLPSLFSTDIKIWRKISKPKTNKAELQCWRKGSICGNKDKICSSEYFRLLNTNLCLQITNRILCSKLSIFCSKFCIFCSELWLLCFKLWLLCSKLSIFCFFRFDKF